MLANNVLIKFLVILVISQLIIPANCLFAQQRRTRENTDTIDRVTVANQVEARLDQPSQDLSLEQDDNPWGLVNQKVIITKGRGNKQTVEVLDLANINIAWHQKLVPPPFNIGSLINVTIDDQSGDVHLTYGTVTQVIGGLNIRSFTKDEELLALLSTDGNIHAINLAQLSHFTSISPIPVFKVASAPSEQEGVNFELEFINHRVTADSKQPLPLSEQAMNSISPNKGFFSGDLAIHDGHSIQYVISRDDILSQISAQTTLLEHLCTISSGSTLTELRTLLSHDRKDLLQVAELLQSKEGITAFSNIMLSNQLRKMSLEGIKAVDKEVRTYLEGLREFVTPEDWQVLIEEFPILKDEATMKIEFEKSQTFFKKISQTISKTITSVSKTTAKALNPMNLLKLANVYKALVSGSPKAAACEVIGATAGTCAAITYGGAIWENLTSYAHHTYQWILDSTAFGMSWSYIFTNAASTSCLFGLLAGVLIAGGIAGYMWNQTTNMAISSFGKKLYALIIGSPSLLLFKTFGSNLPLAFEGGVYKWKKWKAASLPFLPSRAVEKQRLAITKEIDDSRKLSSISSIIAFGVITEADKFDLTSVLRYELSLIKNARTSITKEELKAWRLLTNTLTHKLSFLKGKDISEINNAEKQVAVEIAMVEYENVKTYMSTSNYDAKQKWEATTKFLFKDSPLQAITYLPTPISTYKLFRSLWFSPMDRFAADTIITQFKVDYLTMPIIFNWFGALANKDTPQHKLAASPTEFLFTNPVVLAELVEQIYLYISKAAAEQHMIFGKGHATSNEYLANVISDHLPKNSANQTVYSSVQREPLLKSLMAYFWHSTNFKDAQYGKYFMRSFNTKFQTIHAYFATALAIRLMNGMPLEQSAIIPAYYFWVSMWYYGWIWPVSTRGLQVNEEYHEKRYSEFLTLLNKIENSAKQGNLDTFNQHMIAIKDLYKKKGVDLDKVINSEHMQEMVNKLLIHAKDNPAVYAAPNKALMSTVLAIAAVVTTVIGVYMTSHAMDATVGNLPWAALLSVSLLTITYYGLDRFVPWVATKAMQPYTSEENYYATTMETTNVPSQSTFSCRELLFSTE